MQHYSFDHQFTDGTTVLLIRPIALFHGRRPPQTPEVGPPRPLSLAPLILRMEATMPFSRGPLLAPAPPPAPMWPQFGYLAEVSRGNCALFHGPCPVPDPLGCPPRPLSLVPLKYASGGNYALFQRSTVAPPLPSRIDKEHADQVNLDL